MSPKLPQIRPHPSESVQPPGRETTQYGTTSYSVLSSRPTKCLYPTPHSPLYPSIFYIILYNYISLTRYSYVSGRTWGQSSIIGSRTKGLCVSDPPRRVGHSRTRSDSTVTGPYRAIWGRVRRYGAGCDDTGPGATIRRATRCDLTERVATWGNSGGLEFRSCPATRADSGGALECTGRVGARQVA